MKVSKQAKREAKALFRSCVRDGCAQDALVRSVVQLVLQEKPRGYMAVLSHFHRLLKLDLDRRTARIESAAPLPADLETQVRAKLSQVYGPGLDISFSQNASLIGGMRVKVGSDVYDGSVQGRLAELQQAF
jgi:F-type H+-transporting ATPase subunit delta